jgi:hypothetical protein
VVVLVDAANVVGARPDGWWRDRAGAAGRLLERLAEGLRTGALTGPVVVVLEGAARAAAAEGPSDADGPAGGFRVVHAPRDGDSAIVDEVRAQVSAGAQPVVVTADRGLRLRVGAEGAEVRGPSWLLDRL